MARMLDAFECPPQEVIAEVCRRHGVRRLSIFGSALRGDFRSDSDVDVLVEFEPAWRVGFLGLARLERELSAVFGRRADVRTPGDLSRHFRDDVMRRARLEYAAG